MSSKRSFQYPQAPFQGRLIGCSARNVRGQKGNLFLGKRELNNEGAPPSYNYSANTTMESIVGFFIQQWFFSLCFLAVNTCSNPLVSFGIISGRNTGFICLNICHSNGHYFLKIPYFLKIVTSCRIFWNVKNVQLCKMTIIPNPG